ncbi:hypothetical protein GHT06_010792 [Daphnia sinensis]|uniref:Uncharacterized protein n=1 Tax=Daphnia sinensis TaxID=1820382 RepID=A0AAD5KZ05_9CRUS|nr:hypothetical protein GHT06_010792 [Daphnia sinensis]
MSVGDCLCEILQSKSANSTIIMPGENNGVKSGPGDEKNSKFIRLFTVVAYVCSVSIAAVLLSLYYFFIWDPTTYENSLLTVTSTNNSSYLFGPSLPDDSLSSSSMNATSPLLRPLLGNCSASNDAQGNLTSHLMQDKPSAAF